MIGEVKIDDQIGAYQKDGQTKGITLLGVMEQFKKLPQGTRVVNVLISSPGGLVEEGDFIYEYIKSEKANYVINTVQVGDIASIATKLFLVGDTRSADPQFSFMIHNPWTDPGPGDSKHQAEVLEGLQLAESALRKFYSKELSITEEGLAPLMDRETFLTADQLVTLGFATRLKTQNVFAMANPAKKEPTLKERISALYNSVIKGNIKAVEVSLADGRKLMVDAADEASMVGAAATLDGQPAPDGDYPTAPNAEGKAKVVSVKEGKVANVADSVAQKPAALEDRLTALEGNLSQLTTAVSAFVEANKPGATVAAIEASAKKLEDTFEGKIVALKGEIGTTHQPKQPATVYASTVSKEPSGFRTISQAMADKAQERKNKLNGK